MHRARHILVALLMATTFAAAAAQEIEPRALELLEGWAAAQNQSALAEDDIRTVQMTTVTVNHLLDEPMTTTSSMVVDYENRRLVATSTVMGMESVTRVVDGEVTMTIDGSQMPVPPEVAATFEEVFDQIESGDLLGSIVRATFDGPVDYGGLLVGDQVTYEGDGGVMNAPEAQVVRYVFGADGTMLGAHLDSELGEMLILFEETGVDVDLPAMNMTTYMLTDGEWQLVMEMSYEHLVVNGEIDESLFD